MPGLALAIATLGSSCGSKTAQNDNHQPQPPSPASRLLVLASIIMTTLLLGCLAWRVASYLSSVWCQVRFPFELDYGEGIVWQQTALIPSATMYGRIDTFPFIIFEYPPLYHLAVRSLTMLGADSLIAGRIISVVSTSVIAILCGWLVSYAMRDSAARAARLAGVAVAVLVPLTCYPVVTWLMLMRVDMMAVALTFCGTAFAVVAVRRSFWLCPMLIAFVFAIYTKQTEIVAPIAALVVLSVAKPREAFLAATVGLAIAIVPLLVLEWATQGGFLRHLVLYNVGPFSFHRALETVVWMWDAHVVYWVAAVFGLVIMWWSEVRSSIAAELAAQRTPSGQYGAKFFLYHSNLRVVLAIVSLWFVMSFPTQIAAGKVGSWVNYFIEITCIWSIPIGMLVALVLDRAFSGTIRLNSQGIFVYSMTFILLGGLLWQTMNLLPGRVVPNPAFAEVSKRLVQEIGDAKLPVYSEDMVLLMRSGQTVPLEPVIFSELAQTGAWDQSVFLRRISDRGFAFLIVKEERRYTPEMLAAFQKDYPIVETLGPFKIRRPVDAGGSQESPHF